MLKKKHLSSPHCDMSKHSKEKSDHIAHRNGKTLRVLLYVGISILAVILVGGIFVAASR